MPLRKLVTVSLLCMWSLGCAGKSAAPVKVEVDAATVNNSSLDWSPLSLALQRVTAGSSLKPEGVVESRSILTRFFAQVATVGPQSTPGLFSDKESRLAYWLNVHAAATLLSLSLIADEKGQPANLPGGFDGQFLFEIDGAFMTRADIETKVRSVAGDDWRVELAMATVTDKGPPLPERVYLGEMLDAQLDKAVRDAFSSERVVFVDHGEIKRIQLWEGLWRIRRRLISDFEKDYHTTDATMLNVLLMWNDSSFERITLNSAVGYAEYPMPVTRKVAWKVIKPTDLIDAAMGG